jgi:hypothetical protein
MAFEKRFKNDFVLVKNCEDFINALFNGDKPCELLNEKITKEEIFKFFAGDSHTSLGEFKKYSESTQKRVVKKQKQSDFIKEHNLEMYPHSSYTIFLSVKKSDYEAKNKGKSLKDIRSIMTADWGKMSLDEKEPFETIYTEKKQEFIDKVKEIDPNFVGNFDKSQAPKSAPKPYTVFVQEQIPIIKAEHPEMTSNLVFKEVGNKWKTLTDAEKKKYYEKCNIDFITKKPSQQPQPQPEQTKEKEAPVAKKEKEAPVAKKEKEAPVAKKEKETPAKKEKEAPAKKEKETPAKKDSKQVPVNNQKSKVELRLNKIFDDDDEDEEEEEEEE